MSGVKAVIDVLNVIYEQRESRSFISSILWLSSSRSSALPRFFWQWRRLSYCRCPVAQSGSAILENDRAHRALAGAVECLAVRS